MTFSTREAEFYSISVCGSIREENEDAARTWSDGNGSVALFLADGMGGHARGREAAELVVESGVEILNARRDEAWGELLRAGILRAHERVLGVAQSKAASGMGATAVAALLDSSCTPSRLHLVHVGDSRAYLCRGGSIYRLTSDHSLVSRLVDDGHLTEEEAFGHPDSNVILRAVGQSAPLEPERHDPLAVEVGDTIILCSDGLHGVLRDAEILSVIRRSSSARATCRNLVEAALEAQSEDNVSVACLHLPDRARRPRKTRVGR